MRFVIVGAGALGSILAGLLKHAGSDVCLLARGERAQQVSRDGLKVRGLVTVDTPVQVETDPNTLASADVLIVTVKTYHTESAIAPLASEDFASVFSVANGVQKNSVLAAKFGSEKVLGCMADTSGELLSNGEVLFTRNICLHLGSTEREDENVEAIAAEIDRAGIASRATRTIETVEWSKFVGWTALLALSVTTRMKTADFLSDARLAMIAAMMIREMGAIASAKGIRIVDQSPLPVASVIGSSLDDAAACLVATGQQWQQSAPDHRMSSLQDLERGKALEVHETLGYAVELGTELGLSVPTLETCYKLVAGIDALNV